MSAASDRQHEAGRITLRYWASARAAAGTESDELEVSGPTSLADLLAQVKARHQDSSRFADVIACCALMVGDRPVTTSDPTEVMVQPGATVEFLPPFAGG